MIRRNLFRSLAAVALAAAIDLGATVVRPPRRMWVLNTDWVCAPYEVEQVVHDATLLRSRNTLKTSQLRRGREVVLKGPTCDNGPGCVCCIDADDVRRLAASGCPPIRLDENMQRVPRFIEVIEGVEDLTP